MNRRFVLLVLSTLQLSILTVLGQGTVTGRVVDKLGKPIETAAVYINGTTQRTSTTANGAFELNRVNFPCQLVVSHLGFTVTVMKLEDPPSLPLLLHMPDKEINLSEVSVEGTDQRKELSQSFKDNFLGWDTWGSEAVLLNEKALIYQLSYNEDTVSPSFSGNLYLPNLPKSITNRTLLIEAKEPLQIDLPKLGYTLSFDLDYFSLIQTKPYFNPVTGLTMEPFNISRYKGSYFVKPYENLSKAQQRRYERNRKEAYYNSRMHFCQSLTRNELLKNGFIVIQKQLDAVTNKPMYEFVNFGPYTRYDENGNMQLIGLAGKSFEIHYIGKRNGTPIDLSGKKYKNPVEYVNRNRWYYNVYNCSTIYFINDTCTIKRNGNIPDNSISFDGKINQKKAGAVLPENYTPTEEN